MCICHVASDFKPKVERAWSEVVRTERGWATRYRGSLIHYDDREHAEQQSNAMNLFLVRREIEGNPYVG